MIQRFTGASRRCVVPWPAGEYPTDAVLDAVDGARMIAVVSPNNHGRRHQRGRFETPERLGTETRC